MRHIIGFNNISGFKCGQEVFFTGFFYTARDQAHRRFVQAINNKKHLPVDLGKAALYYCGPTATPKGKVIGSCGPTTSSRMDNFSPLLLKNGLKVMIGKGSRSGEVIKAIKKYKAVYFIAPAGCGALLSTCVKKKTAVAYKDLGPEAIYRLEVKDFPLIVAIDAKGRNIYKEKH